jgi:tetratricopeptide (TPR) repeat protein
VGEALERLFPDRAEELVGLLAYHWERAGDHEKAIASLTRAGQLAAAQFANAEAVNYYNRALALLPAGQDAARYDLLIACDIVYDLMADRTNQRRGLQDLAALAETAGNDSWRSQVAQRWANYYCGTGDFAAAQDQAQKAVRLGEAVQNLNSQAGGYFVWGRVLRLEQRYEAARERLSQGLAAARAAGDRSLEGSILRNIGNVYYFQKDLLSGKTCIEQALRIHREIGDRSNEAASLNSLGLICTELGDPAANRAHLEQALSIYREIGDRYGQGMVLSNLGDYYRGQFQYGQAKESYEQGLASWKQAGYQLGEAGILNNLGWLEYFQGNYAAARTDFEQALSIAQAANNLARCAEAFGGLGRVAEAQADFIQARRNFEKALALDQELGDSANIFLEQTNLALVSRRLGELETAERAFIELLQQCRQAGEADFRDFECICLQALASVAQQQGNHTAAQAHSRRALELAQEKNDRLSQGTALIGLGHALAGLEDREGAAGAYQRALGLLRELSARHRRQPDALAGLAELALARQDFPQALAYVA